MVKNNHSPTAFTPLLGAFLPHIHANSVILEGGWDVLTVFSIILLVAGLILIIGSFFWQKKIDKDKRKW